MQLFNSFGKLSLHVIRLGKDVNTPKGPYMCNVYKAEQLETNLNIDMHLGLLGGVGRSIFNTIVQLQNLSKPKNKTSTILD